MKFTVVFSAVLCLLSLNVSAFTDNFYLEKLTRAEKLMPEKLVVTLNENETDNITVDVLPAGAVCDISWKIYPAIATVLPRNNKCVIKAITAGDAVLTATADSGVSCDIKIKILPAKTEILLQASDNIESGKSAVIYAKAKNNEEVSWRVEGVDASRVSFGGNVCRIKPQKEGNITVFATSGNTTVSKTLKVLPSKYEEFNLSHLGLIFATAGVVLLLIVLIYGRDYEKKY